MSLTRSELDGPLSLPGILKLAWISWVLCLICSVGGFLFSAYATKRVICLLDAEVYDASRLTGGPAHFIAWFNRAAYTLLIAGFIGFGVFTFDNLKFEGSNGQVEEEGSQASQKEPGSSLYLQGQSTCEQSATPAAELPTSTKEEVVNERQEVDRSSAKEGGFREEESTSGRAEGGTGKYGAGPASGLSG